MAFLLIFCSSVLKHSTQYIFTHLKNRMNQSKKKVSSEDKAAHLSSTHFSIFRPLLFYTDPLTCPPTQNIVLSLRDLQQGHECSTFAVYL